MKEIYYLYTDADGEERFHVVIDDLEMDVPLDGLRTSIERFDREKCAGKIYQQRVRIVGKPGDVSPSTISVVDADTEEALPMVYQATIYLDVNQVNRAELTYYETNEQGNIRTVNDQVQIRKSINELAEVDVTAYEVKRKKP